MGVEAQCQAKGHRAWDTSQCVVPTTRKLTEPVRGKTCAPRAPKTEATKTDHDRDTALAGTRGPGVFYEYLFKKNYLFYLAMFGLSFSPLAQ